MTMSRAWSNDASLTRAYPESAGHIHGSVTSRLAADSINPKLGRLHELVLAAFRAWSDPSTGWTDDELDAYLSCYTKTARPRRIELTALGYLKDSGRTRTTASGRQATVWVLA